MNYNGLHTLPAVGPLILGSSVYNVSVPGLVADTHNSNKIDIKNYTFITNGENTLHDSSLHSLGHWPYIVYQSSKTMVLYYHGFIPTSNLECGRNPRLIP